MDTQVKIGAKTDVQRVYEALLTIDGGANVNRLAETTGFTVGRVNQALKQLTERSPAYAMFDSVEQRWMPLVPRKDARFLKKHDRTPPRPKPKPKPVPRLPEVEAAIEAMSTLIAKYEDLVTGLQPLIKLMEEKKDDQ